MTETPLLALALRAVATTGFVLGMGWLVAFARPRIAAAAVGMPVVIGPGFLVLALERDVAFFTAAAEAGLGAMAATVAFVGCAAALGRRLAPPLAVAGGLLAWAAAIAAVAPLEGLGANCIAFLAAYALLTRLAPPAVGRKRGTWRRGRELLRAAAAGALVAAVTALAGLLGAGLAGALLALPVGLIVIASSVLSDSAPEAAAAILAAAARGTLALAVFCAVAAAAADATGMLVAVAAATLCSVATASLLAAFGRK